MTSFKPIILATAVATILFAHAASAAAAQSERSVVSMAKTERADTTILIASSEGRAEITDVAGPAVGWDAGKRGARNAALQGSDALRRFVERTRTIYALQYADFAPLDR